MQKYIIQTYFCVLDSSDMKIGFHAHLKSVPRLTDGQLIDFDNVTINLGNAYTKGTFTAPKSGRYYFAFTVTSGNNSAVNWQLKSGGKVYATIRSSSTDGSHDTAKGHAIIGLKSRQTVFVSHIRHNGSLICDDYMCPMFSGFRLS